MDIENVTDSTAAIVKAPCLGCGAMTYGVLACASCCAKIEAGKAKATYRAPSSCQ